MIMILDTPIEVKTPIEDLQPLPRTHHQDYSY
jgi:hypothetical protein